MSLPSNAKRFSSPTHSGQQSLPRSRPKEKPNIYSVPAASGNRLVHFVTEDGKAAPHYLVRLVEQFQPQIKTKILRFPPGKLVTATLTAGGYIADLCLDREVPDKPREQITPDLNKDNVIQGLLEKYYDKPIATRPVIHSSTVVQQKPKSSVMPQREFKRSQLIQPQPSVSQPLNHRGVAQVKHHGSTSMLTNNEEAGQLVANHLHNVGASQHELSPSQSRVKVLEAEIQVLKKKNSTSQTRNKALETMCQQYKARVQQKMLEADRATEQQEIVVKGNESLLTKCEHLNSSLKEKEESEAQELQNYQNEVGRLKAELAKKDKEMRKQNGTLLGKCEQLNSCLNKNEESEFRLLQNHQNEVEKLNAELVKRDKELANCKQSKAVASKTLVGMCQQYKTQLQQLTLEADSANEQKGFMTKRYAILLAKCEKLNLTLNEKEESKIQQVQNYQKVVDKLNAELQRRGKELENCMQKVADSDRKVIGLESRKEFLTKQNQILLAKCDQLNSSLKEQGESEGQQLQKHRKEVEKMNVELEKRNKALENCTQKVADSNSKVVTLEAMNASLESELKSLKKRISEQQKVSTENKEREESAVGEETVQLKS